MSNNNFNSMSCYTVIRNSDQFEKDMRIVSAAANNIGTFSMENAINMLANACMVWDDNIASDNSILESFNITSLETSNSSRSCKNNNNDNHVVPDTANPPINSSSNDVVVTPGPMATQTPTQNDSSSSSGGGDSAANFELTLRTMYAEFAKNIVNTGDCSLNVVDNGDDRLLLVRDLYLSDADDVEKNTGNAGSDNVVADANADAETIENCSRADDADDESDSEMKKIAQQIKKVKRKLNLAKNNRKHFKTPTTIVATVASPPPQPQQSRSTKPRIEQSESSSSPWSAASNSSSESSATNSDDENCKIGENLLIQKRVQSIPAAVKKPKCNQISADGTRPIRNGLGKRIDPIISRKMQQAFNQTDADAKPTNDNDVSADPATMPSTLTEHHNVATTSGENFAHGGGSSEDDDDDAVDEDKDADYRRDENDDDIDDLTVLSTNVDGKVRDYAIRSRCALQIPDTVNVAFVCSDDGDNDGKTSSDDDDVSENCSREDGDDDDGVTSDSEAMPKNMQSIVHSKSRGKSLPKYCCTIDPVDLESKNDNVDMKDLLIRNRAETEAGLAKRKKLTSKKDTEFACWSNCKYTKHLKRDKIFGLSAYKNCKLPVNDPIHSDKSMEYTSLYSVIHKFYEQHALVIRFASSDLGEKLKLYTENHTVMDSLTASVVNNKSDMRTYYLRYGFIPDKFVMELGVLLDKMLKDRKRMTYDFLEGEIELYFMAYWQLTVGDLQWNVPTRKQKSNKDLFLNLYDSLIFDVHENFERPERAQNKSTQIKTRMTESVYNMFKNFFISIGRVARFCEDPYCINNESLFLIKQAIPIIMADTQDSKKNYWLLFFKTMNIQHLELPYTYNRLLKTRDAYIEQFYRKVEPLIIDELLPERSVFLNGLHGERFVASKIKHPAVFSQEDVQCLLPMVFSSKKQVPLYLCVKLDNFFMLVIHWFVKLTSKNQIFASEKLNQVKSNIFVTEQHASTFFHVFMNNFTYYNVHMLEFAYSKNIITKFGKAITCEFTYQLENLEVKVVPDSQLLGTLLLLTHSLLNTQWSPVLLRENDSITLTEYVALLMDELIFFENYTLTVFNGFSLDQPSWLGGSRNDPSFDADSEMFSYDHGSRGRGLSEILRGSRIAEDFYSRILPKKPLSASAADVADSCSNSDTDRDEYSPTAKIARIEMTQPEVWIRAHKPDYSDLRTPSAEVSDFCESDSESELCLSESVRCLKKARLMRENRQLENDLKLPLLNQTRLWCKIPDIAKTIKSRKADCVNFYADNLRKTSKSGVVIGVGDDADLSSDKNEPMVVNKPATVGIDGSGGDTVDTSSAAPNRQGNLKTIKSNKMFEKERVGAEKLKRSFVLAEGESLKTVDGVLTFGLIPNIKMERGSRSFICVMCDQNVRSSNNLRVSDDVCVCCCMDCTMRLYNMLRKKQFDVSGLQEIITNRVNRRYRAPLLFVTDRRRLIDTLDAPILKFSEMYAYTYNKFAANYGRKLPHGREFFMQMSQELNWDNGFSSRSATVPTKKRKRSGADDGIQQPKSKQRPSKKLKLNIRSRSVVPSSPESISASRSNTDSD